jgi:anti-sigma28 factor (negative regulator of flagellin synthesis)
MGSVSSQQRAINKRRESAEHQAKLDRLREQIASGGLVIRQATAAERRQWQREREQRSDP